MGKKIIYGIAILIIIVGTILTATIGINLSMEYNENTKIYVYIGKQFENKDIKQIAFEIFETNSIIVKKVEVYEDMACIILEKQNEENLNEKVQNLNTKINAKYEIGNKVEDITIKNEPKIELYTIIKPYVWPIIISTIIILAYALIMFRKIGFMKIAIMYILSIVASQTLYASLIAITRLPICKYTIPVALIIYVISIIVVTITAQKKLLNYKTDKN